jgi:hypothetical protein
VLHTHVDGGGNLVFRESGDAAARENVRRAGQIWLGACLGRPMHKMAGSPRSLSSGRSVSLSAANARLNQLAVVRSATRIAMHAHTEHNESGRLENIP